jgi:hypothetical protein
MPEDLDMKHERSPADYLGPLCPVCHAPWSAHPLPLSGGKVSACEVYRVAEEAPPPDPVSMHVDQLAVEVSRERHRARVAEREESG